MSELRRTTNKAKWKLAYAGELSADCLNEIATTGGRLSLWLVAADAPHLERFIAAMAAKKGHVQTIDLVSFASDAIARLNLVLEESSGDVADVTVATWHRDVVHLTTRGLAELAQSVDVTSGLHRFYPRQVLPALAASVQVGWLPRERLSEEILAKLDDFTREPGVVTPG